MVNLQRVGKQVASLQPVVPLPRVHCLTVVVHTMAAGLSTSEADSSTGG